jgi:hypothetical protein
VSGTRGRRFAGGTRGAGPSRPGRLRLPSPWVGGIFSALGRGRLFVTLVAVALLLCHGAFGYAHQLPAVDVQSAHAAHAMGVHQPGQDQTSDGSHLQEAYFATLLLLLFGASLLMGGWLPAGAKLPAPALRTDRTVWRLHPPRGPTPSYLQVFRL